MESVSGSLAMDSHGRLTGQLMSSINTDDKFAGGGSKQGTDHENMSLHSRSDQSETRTTQSHFVEGEKNDIFGNDKDSFRQYLSPPTLANENVQKDAVDFRFTSVASSELEPSRRKRRKPLIPPQKFAVSRLKAHLTDVSESEDDPQEESTTESDYPDYDHGQINAAHALNNFHSPQRVVRSTSLRKPTQNGKLIDELIQKAVETALHSICHVRQNDVAEPKHLIETAFNNMEPGIYHLVEQAFRSTFANVKGQLPFESTTCSEIGNMNPTFVDVASVNGCPELETRTFHSAEKTENWQHRLSAETVEEQPVFVECSESQKPLFSIGNLAFNTDCNDRNLSYYDRASVENGCSVKKRPSIMDENLMQRRMILPPHYNQSDSNKGVPSDNSTLEHPVLCSESTSAAAYIADKTRAASIMSGFGRVHQSFSPPAHLLRPLSQSGKQLLSQHRPLEYTPISSSPSTEVMSFSSAALTETGTGITSPHSTLTGSRVQQGPAASILAAALNFVNPLWGSRRFDVENTIQSLPPHSVLGTWPVITTSPTKGPEFAVAPTLLPFGVHSHCPPLNVPMNAGLAHASYQPTAAQTYVLPNNFPVNQSDEQTEAIPLVVRRNVKNEQSGEENKKGGAQAASLYFDAAGIQQPSVSVTYGGSSVSRRRRTKVTDTRLNARGALRQATDTWAPHQCQPSNVENYPTLPDLGEATKSSLTYLHGGSFRYPVRCVDYGVNHPWISPQLFQEPRLNSGSSSPSPSSVRFSSGPRDGMTESDRLRGPSDRRQTSDTMPHLKPHDSPTAVSPEGVEGNNFEQTLTKVLKPITNSRGQRTMNSLMEQIDSYTAFPKNVWFGQRPSSDLTHCTAPYLPCNGRPIFDALNSGRGRFSEASKLLPTLTTYEKHSGGPTRRAPSNPLFIPISRCNSSSPVDVDCASSLHRSDGMRLTSTLTPVHLRKAKLMFFYTRYPNSTLIKLYFPDVKFYKNNTAQLVKWFSNFREFYYIQMEKFARVAISEGVRTPDEIHVTTESELYRALNLHYNRNHQLEVPDHFRVVVEATLREFFNALMNGKDAEQSWKKPIYKIIARMDQPVPEFFKNPNWMEQLTDG
ncbi:unnamed protein product [Dicrocoelium dendriticum]|nr:unnamed protein product [Dicrocoelium dendriticum]